MKKYRASVSSKRRTHAQEVARDQRHIAKREASRRLTFLRRARARALARLRARCKAARLATSAWAKERRAAARAAVNAEIAARRAEIRARCQASAGKVKSHTAKRAAQAKNKRKARAAEAVLAAKAPRLHAARAAEAIHQSDDAVRRNLPADLVPVFDRIKNRIKGSPKRSRTEAFLQWVEENPGEVVAMQDQRAERELRALLRAQGARAPRKAVPRSKMPPPSTSWDDVWEAADSAVYLD